jgi:hypothetical protein
MVVGSHPTSERNRLPDTEVMVEGKTLQASIVFYS